MKSVLRVDLYFDNIGITVKYRYELLTDICLVVTFSKEERNKKSWYGLRTYIVFKYKLNL
jgi:hypothetical protein